MIERVQGMMRGFAIGSLDCPSVRRDMRGACLLLVGTGHWIVSLTTLVLLLVICVSHERSPALEHGVDHGGWLGIRQFFTSHLQMLVIFEKLCTMKEPSCSYVHF